MVYMIFVTVFEKIFENQVHYYYYYYYIVSTKMLSSTLEVLFEKPI